MIKFLALIVTLYGFGVIGVGISQTTEAWGSQDLPVLIESGLRAGLSWPATFIGWLV